MEAAVGLQAERIAGHRRQQAASVEVQQEGVVGGASGDRDLHVEGRVEAMDQEFAERFLQRLDHQRIERTAADRQQETDLGRAQLRAFERVGDGREDRAAQRVFVFVGLQAFGVQEGRHQFREAESVEGGRGQLQLRAIGEAQGLHARVGLDRIGEDLGQVGAVGLAMDQQLAEPHLQLFGRRQQLGFELLLADLVFPVFRRDAILAGQFRDEDLVHDGAVDVGAAETVVTRDRAGAHAERPIGHPAQREDRDVAGAAAEIDDHRLRLVGHAVEDRGALPGEEVEESGERLVEQVAVAEAQAGQVGRQQRVFALGDLEGSGYRHHRAADGLGGLVTQEAKDLAGDFGGAAAAGLRLGIGPADAHLILRLGQIIDERTQAQLDGAGETAAGPLADQLPVGQLADDRRHQHGSEIAAERRLRDFKAGGRGDDVRRLGGPADLGHRGIGGT